MLASEQHLANESRDEEGVTLTSPMHLSDSDGRGSIDLLMNQARLAHIASIFKNEADQFSSAVPFILSAVDTGDKCIYITDRNTKDDVLDFVMKTRDIQTQLDSGQVSFLTKDDTYLKGGRFNINRMLGAWKKAEKRALLEGYGGLRGAGEMTWSKTDAPGVRGLVEYEARVNYLYPGLNADFLCQYDEPSFDPGTLLDIIRVHPRVVIRGEMCYNPYFTPPDEFLAGKRGSVPKAVYERTANDILKRSHFSMIHGLELREFRKNSRKLSILNEVTFNELRGRFAVVEFYNELATSSCPDERTRTHLGEISSKCLSIRKLLESAKMHQQAGESGPQWQDLGRILDRVAVDAGREGVALTHSVKEIRVLSDSSLEGVLLAIVDSSPDGADKFKASCRESGNELTLRLESPGKGVPDDLKAAIFDVGQRYGNSDGFRLFLARETLLAANLTIRESGVFGKSTLFEINFPSAKYVTRRSHATGS